MLDILMVLLVIIDGIRIHECLWCRCLDCLRQIDGSVGYYRRDLNS
jgi:hypothetical protein